MTDETRKHLDDLHEHLTEAVNSGNAEAGEVRDRLDAYLASTESSEDEDRDIIESFGDAARRFEMEHPRLSHALQSVIDSLTAAGI